MPENKSSDVSTCAYQHHPDINCQRPAIGSDSTAEKYCILHSKDPIKDRAAFRKELQNQLDVARDYNFRRVVFPEDISVHFLYKNFQNAAFDQALFLGEVDFSGAKFLNAASFYETRFSKPAVFRAIFYGPAMFNNAEFMEAADFDNAEFVEDAVFSRVRFLGPVSFGFAKFSRSANFYSAEFSQQAEFVWTSARKKFDFQRARFNAGAIFTLESISGAEETPASGDQGAGANTKQEQTNQAQSTTSQHDGSAGSQVVQRSETGLVAPQLVLC